MGSCAGHGKRTGGLTGVDAEVGALVWVLHRNGYWWPGRILGADELPENVVPPRSTDTPIKLLGGRDGTINWYNLEKSKRVKPFRCGEFDECIENAKVQAGLQKMAYTEGKHVFREDAIMHALEIERSLLSNGLNDAMYASKNNCAAEKFINGLNKRSSRVANSLYDIEEYSAEGISQNFTSPKQSKITPHSSTTQPSVKKRKAQDFVDDAVQRLDLSRTSDKCATDVNEAEVLCTTRFLNDDSSDGDEFFDAPLTLDNDVLEQGYLNAYGLCASMKEQILKPSNQTADCSKVVSSIQDNNGSSKNKSISSVTPISEQNYKRDKNLLLQQYEGTERCQSLDSDTVGLGARAEDPVCNPREVYNNIQLHDVKLTVRGNYEGRKLPLAFILSNYTGKLIRGYPISVEVVEDSFLAADRNNHCTGVTSADWSQKSKIPVPLRARPSHALPSKPSGPKKISKHDLDKSWRLHTKKLSSSRREMQSFSAFASGRRESAHRKPFVAKGSPLPVHSPLVAINTRSTGKYNLRPTTCFGGSHCLPSDPLPGRSPTVAAVNAGSTDKYHLRPETHFAGSSSNSLQLYPSPAHSPPVAAVSAGSTDKCHRRPATHFAGSNGLPLDPSPARSPPVASVSAGSTDDNCHARPAAHFAGSNGLPMDPSPARSPPVAAVSAGSTDDSCHASPGTHFAGFHGLPLDPSPARSPPAAAVNAGNTGKYHVKPATHFPGSRGLPSDPSPEVSSIKSRNGCSVLYLCSSSKLCAPVRLRLV
ncbi:hypothetical protein ACP70R_046683 [Stipagrostis hirtigluma subsp. patula]